jgi:hypothetical protein
MRRKGWLAGVVPIAARGDHNIAGHIKTLMKSLNVFLGEGRNGLWCSGQVFPQWMVGPQKAIKKFHDRVLGQVAVHFDLLHDDCFFFDDIRIGDAWPGNHVRQDIKGLFKMLGGDLGVETGLLFGRERVERPAHAFDRGLDLFAGIFFTAFKNNVFQEMGCAFKPVGFMPAADADPESQRDRVAVFHVVGDHP